MKLNLKGISKWMDYADARLGGAIYAHGVESKEEYESIKRKIKDIMKTDEITVSTEDFGFYSHRIAFANSEKNIELEFYILADQLYEGSASDYYNSADALEVEEIEITELSERTHIDLYVHGIDNIQRAQEMYETLVGEGLVYDCDFERGLYDNNIVGHAKNEYYSKLVIFHDYPANVIEIEGMFFEGDEHKLLKDVNGIIERVIETVHPKEYYLTAYRISDIIYDKGNVRLAFWTDDKNADMREELATLMGKILKHGKYNILSDLK